MNYKRGLIGAIGMIAGSFICGGIVSVIRSNKETKELIKKSEESIAESERLIEQMKSDRDTLRDINNFFEDEIQRIQRIQRIQNELEQEQTE